MALITRVDAQARVHPPSPHCGGHGVPHPLECFKHQFDLPRSIARGSARQLIYMAHNLPSLVNSVGSVVRCVGRVYHVR